MVSDSGGKNLAIKMNNAFIARIDKLAHRAEITRSRLMKNFLEVGIEELETMKSVGFFQLGVLLRDVSDSIFKGKKMADPVSGDRPIPIKIDDDYISRLDALAEKAGLSRHQLMKNILEVGVDECEMFAKVGVLDLVLVVRDLHDAFKKISTRGEKALKAAGHE